MQVLNLSRQFELLRIKEEEHIQDYLDKVMKLVNQLRLLGEDVSDWRVVNEILVSLPKRFEAKISSLDDSKDFTRISITELINAFLAQKQIRDFR